MSRLHKSLGWPLAYITQKNREYLRFVAFGKITQKCKYSMQIFFNNFTVKLSTEWLLTFEQIVKCQ